MKFLQISAILISLVINIPFRSYADTTQTVSTKIEFVYDGAGNRIMRQVKAEVAPQGINNLSKREFPVNENINIYPNPVESVMNIDIKGFDSNNDYSMALYSETGVLLIETILSAPRNQIELNSLSSGSYVAIITKDGELVSQGYKIIKL